MRIKRFFEAVSIGEGKHVPRIAFGFFP